MNNQQHSNLRNNYQPISPQLTTHFNQQNSLKGTTINHLSSPLNQMENIQYVPNSNPQHFACKPERQKNALYMSSMEFSHSQNNSHRYQNHGVNMKTNINTNGRQPNVANLQNFQRTQPLNIPDRPTSDLNNKTFQFANKNNENTQLQKKYDIVMTQNPKNVQKAEKKKSRKNIEEIQAIKRQLEDINGKMQKLGMQSEHDSFKNQNQPRSVNRNFQAKAQIAHSMIVSHNNQSMCFNSNGQAAKNGNNFPQQKTTLTLQETYQKMKHQKIQKQTQKPTIPSFLSAKQEQTPILNQNSKDFFNLASKDRRIVKAKTSHGLNIDESEIQHNQHKYSADQTILTFADQQSYKNLKYSTIEMPYQNQSNFSKTTIEPSSTYKLPSTLQFSQKSINQNQTTINLDSFNHTSTSKNQKVFDDTKSDSQASSQFSTAEQASSPKTFFKKKGVQPEYFVSSASQQSALKKAESFEDISPFGPQKITKEDFQIGKKMGKGQFGQVNLVRHKKTGFLCAMKTMQKKQIRQQKYEGQIARELSIQFYLSHRNITPLYGYFQDEFNVYLLVQFCPDGHLLGVLKKVRRMEEQDVSPIIKQIIEGIDYIHKEKIIHRDIKPQNILFSNGVAKIVDFGWAVYRGLGLRKTASGSPLYYSPEIVMGTQYDQKIDIWDIGMMTYECLLGKVPFRVYTEMDLNRIATDQVTFPSYVDTTPQAQDFILKILQKKPQDRMTIREMLRHPFITKYSQKKLPIQIMTDIHNILK